MPALKVGDRFSKDYDGKNVKCRSIWHKLEYQVNDQISTFISASAIKYYIQYSKII